MRLIDADACPCNTCRTLCCEHPMQCHRFYTWRKNQAYDVEKVVEQLEEEREHSYADFCDYLMEYELDNDFEVDDDWFYKGLIRAKQIVRKGGVE